MLAGLVAVEVLDVARDLVGPHLALVFGQREHLVSRRLDGPRLVDVDVSRRCGQHPFVPAQQAVDDRGVGLGAAHQQIDLGLGRSARLADELAGMGRMGVASVSGALFEVGLDQAAHHLGMGSLHVVAIEMKHCAACLIGWNQLRT